jgi:hypothetical protein
MLRLHNAYSVRHARRTFCSQLKSGRMSAPRQPRPEQMNLGPRSRQPTIGAADRYVVAYATKISHSPQIRPKVAILLPTVAGHSFKKSAWSIEPRGGHTMASISFTAINVRVLGLNQRSSRATTWHLCSVIVPRRTITGRLVRGKVWRRHDGRHWLYKKFVAG